MLKRTRVGVSRQSFAASPCMYLPLSTSRFIFKRGNLIWVVPFRSSFEATLKKTYFNMRPST